MDLFAEDSLGILFLGFLIDESQAEIRLDTDHKLKVRPHNINRIQGVYRSHNHLPVRRHFDSVKLIDTIQAAFFTAHTHVSRDKLEVNNLHFDVLFASFLPSHLYLAVFLVECLKEVKECKAQVLLTHTPDKTGISLSYRLV